MTRVFKLLIWANFFSLILVLIFGTALENNLPDELQSYLSTVESKEDSVLLNLSMIITVWTYICSLLLLLISSSNKVKNIFIISSIGLIIVGLFSGSIVIDVFTNFLKNIHRITLGMIISILFFEKRDSNEEK